MTCHIWNYSAGTKLYSDLKRFKEMVDQIIKVIDSKPGEEFLVIYRKHTINKLPDTLKEKFGDEITRVRFLQYGFHTATNQYSDIVNIILAGSLFYENASYEAIARMAADFPITQGDLPKEDINSVKMTEISHHIFQAACRGAIRKYDGNSCPETNLWLIAHSNTGIANMIGTIFPGCKLTEWIRDEEKLSNKQLKVMEIIERKLEVGEVSISIPELCKNKDVNLRDNPGFKRDICKGKFIDFLEEKRLKWDGKGKNSRFIKI